MHSLRALPRMPKELPVLPKRSPVEVIMRVLCCARSFEMLLKRLFVVAIKLGSGIVTYTNDCLLWSRMVAWASPVTCMPRILD